MDSAPLSFGGLLQRLQPWDRSLFLSSRHRHRGWRDSDVDRRDAGFPVVGPGGPNGGVRLIGDSPVALRIGEGQSGGLLRVCRTITLRSGAVSQTLFARRPIQVATDALAQS